MKNTDRVNAFERIEELGKLNKEFEAITGDADEKEILKDLRGTIEEAIFYYKEKLQ